MFLGISCFAVTDSAPQKRYCRVQTFFKHVVEGGNCRYLDEVMIGIKSLEPLTIYCASLEAFCRGADGKMVEVPVDQEPS